MRSESTRISDNPFIVTLADAQIFLHARGMPAIYSPLWPLITLAVIPTAILWHRDRRTAKPGHCVKCGYDLRASKDRCPECGEEFDSELITTADGDCGGC